MYNVLILWLEIKGLFCSGQQACRCFVYCQFFFVRVVVVLAGYICVLWYSILFNMIDN